MKIYTKTGDAGETGLFGGPRVSKDHARIEAYGDVDELNSAVGVARASLPGDRIDEVLGQIQNDLFSVGAELATPDPQSRGTDFIGEADIERLETTIDEFEAELQPLTQFVLPGGTLGASHLHLARTICRRSERRVVSLVKFGETISETVVKYLNRLSDLLFVLARAANAEQGQADIPWDKPKSS